MGDVLIIVTRAGQTARVACVPNHLHGSPWSMALRHVRHTHWNSLYDETTDSEEYMGLRGPKTVVTKITGIYDTDIRL